MTDIEGASVKASDHTAPTGTAPVWAAIPQPSRVELRTGSWMPRAVSVLADDERLRRERERFEDELRSFGAVRASTKIVNAESVDAEPVEQVTTGDEASRVEMRLDGEAGFGTEGFSIEVGHNVTLTAGTPTGIFRGTRQLMHNLRVRGSVPAASVRSDPAVGERGLHIDAARKYYPASWLERLIVDAADIGLTTLQWHFSENEGVRLESLRFSEVVSAEHITRAEAQHLIGVARDNHIEIVPSLDMPGHLRHALTQHPEFALADATGALDITNAEAVAFALALVGDYAGVFAESRFWNLGGDEFVDFDRMAEYPVLVEAARTRFGEAGTGFDLLTEFVNAVAEHVSGLGFVPRVWNDGMLRSANVALDARAQFTWWTNWNAAMRPVREAFEAGHRVVNVNDAMFYYVLGENAGYTYPTSERLWAADWHPGVFPLLHPSAQNREQTLARPYPEQLTGTSFAIWSDRPDAQTCEEVADGVRSPLRGFAERSWNAGSALTHAEFAVLDASLLPVAGR